MVSVTRKRIWTLLQQRLTTSVTLEAKLSAKLSGLPDWSQPNEKQPNKAMIRAIGLAMKTLKAKVMTEATKMVKPKVMRMDMPMAIKKAIVKAIVRVIRLVGVPHLHLHLHPVITLAA